MVTSVSRSGGIGKRVSTARVSKFGMKTLPRNFHRKTLVATYMRGPIHIAPFYVTTTATLTAVCAFRYDEYVLGACGAVGSAHDWQS